ncbi:hypothetical protein PV326_006662 [Microctonus aethiopoides]|nr:hypothetical protein PV326_006662 [Microctonus aethiopoides]
MVRCDNGLEGGVEEERERKINEMEKDLLLFYRTMWSCSLLACVILILCEYSNASQIVGSLTDQHGIGDIMSEIIRNCFSKMSTILFMNEANVSWAVNPSENEIISSFILGNSANQSYSSNGSSTSIKCMIITATSAEKLGKLIKNLASKTPSHYYIISDDEQGQNSCNSAMPFLMEAWINDLLNVIFICNNGHNRSSSLFTFNPYIDSAPNPWKKVSTHPAINDHPWTLFTQSYETNEAACNSLFFEKTKDLGGYLIKLVTVNFPPYSMFDLVDSRATNLIGFDGIVNQMLWTKLNATNIIYSRVGLNFSYALLKVIPFMFNKSANILLVSQFMKPNLPMIEFSHPTRLTAVTIMSLKKGYMTPFEKLLLFIPLYIMALFLITSILAFVAVTYIFKDPYSTNHFEAFRVYLSQSLPRLPVTNAGRLLFGSVLIIFLILNGVLQGNFAKVLAVQQEHENVETVKDINDLGYTVIGTPYVTRLLEKSGVERIKILQSHLNCSGLSKNVTLAAEEWHLRTLFTRNCYIPKKHIINMYLTYYMRRQWALCRKVNRLILMIFEGGIFEYWYLKLSRKSKMRESSTKYRPLLFEDLSFAFYILLGGLFCSAIAFIIEIVIAKIKQQTQPSND